MSAAKKCWRSSRIRRKAMALRTWGALVRNGKAEARGRFVIREPMTEKIVQGHIDGGQGIGSIPIRSGDVCKFGALDIDVYDLDHKTLNKKIQD